LTDCLLLVFRLIWLRAAWGAGSCLFIKNSVQAASQADSDEFSLNSNLLGISQEPDPLKRMGL
jgi:hypothetical protein